MYEEDLQITQRKLDDQEEVFKTLSSIGHIYCKPQDYKNARDQYEEYLQMQRLTFNDDDLRVVLPCSNLAFVANEQGRHKKALTLYHNILWIQRIKLTTGHNKLQHTSGQLNCYWQVLNLLAPV